MRDGMGSARDRGRGEKRGDRRPDVGTERERVNMAKPRSRLTLPKAR